MIAKLIDITKEKYYSKYGLFLGILAITIIFYSIPPLDELTRISIFFPISITIVWIIIWCYFQNKFPITRNNQKGVYIIINTEDTDPNEKRKVENRVNNDLLKEIENELTINNLSKMIKIHYLNEFQKKKLTRLSNGYIEHKNVENDIKKRDAFIKIHKKLKGTYYIWGDLIIRRPMDDESYIIKNIHGIVGHSIIPEIISKKLSEEFNKILIKNFEIKRKEEVESFDKYSKINLIAILYIIGLATSLSKEYENAIKILYSALNSIEKYFKNEIRQELSLRIKIEISDALLKLANEKMENKDYKEALRINTQNDKLIPNNPITILQRVNLEFLTDNLENALKINERLKMPNDISYLYNKGFILMCMGKFKTAYQIYKYIEKTKINKDHLYIQNCVDNNIVLIGLKTNYYCIHYILGFLYYVELKNPAAAFEHFEFFKEYYGNSKNIELKNFLNDTNKYLKNIKSELDIC